MDKSTRFREQVAGTEAHKTRSGRAAEGAILAAAGLGLLVVGVIGTVALSSAGWIGCGCIGLAIVGLVMLIAGIFQTVIAPMRRARKVACPQCAHEHNVLVKTGLVLCPECSRPLLLTPGEKGGELSSVSCVHCGAPAAVDAATSSWACPSCGAVHGPAPAGIAPQGPCPTCGEPLPAGARFCTKCSSVLAERFAGPYLDQPGLLARTGMTPEGHWAWATAVMRQQDTRIAGQAPTDNLVTTLDLLRHLVPVFESLEEAAQAPDQRERVIWALKYADGLYGRMLQRAAWELGQSKRALRVPKLTPLDKSEHVTQRQRVLVALDPQLGSPGQLGLAEWSAGLVKFGDAGNDGPKRYKIKDWNPLHAEMLRLTGAVPSEPDPRSEVLPSDSPPQPVPPARPDPPAPPVSPPGGPGVPPQGNINPR